MSRKWRKRQREKNRRMQKAMDLEGSSATGTDQAVEAAANTLSQEEVDALLNRGSSATGADQAAEGPSKWLDFSRTKQANKQEAQRAAKIEQGAQDVVNTQGPQEVVNTEEPQEVVNTEELERIKRGSQEAKKAIDQRTQEGQLVVDKKVAAAKRAANIMEMSMSYDNAASELGNMYSAKARRYTAKSNNALKEIEGYKQKLSQYNDEQFDAMSKRVKEYDRLKNSKAYKRMDEVTRADASNSFRKDLETIAGDTGISDDVINNYSNYNKMKVKQERYAKAAELSKEKAQGWYSFDTKEFKDKKITPRELRRGIGREISKSSSSGSWGKGKWAAAAGVVGAALGALAVGVGVSHMMMSGGQQSNTNLYNPGYASY